MSAIDDLIIDARNYAVTTMANATSAMAGAQNAIDNIGRGSIGGSTPKVDVLPPKVRVSPDAPEYKGKRFTFERFTKNAPTLSNVGTLTLPSEPGSVPDVRAFNEPNKPTLAPSTAVLGNAPTVNGGLTGPTAPTLNIEGIPTPNIIAINLPNAPTYMPPQFLGVKPAFNEVAPTGAELSAQMRSEYATISPIMRDAVTAQIDAFIDREFPQHRANLAAIESRLNTYLQGGTALTPAIEDAIFNRTLDKTNREMVKAKDEAWRKAARAGFTMPSAMLLAQQIDIDQAGRDNNARAATEIAIKQAELEQQNLQFAVTQSANLRKIAIDAGLAYYNGLIQINGQAVEYARSTVDYVVKAYDIATRYAEVQIKIYEADMRRYEADLKAALALFDVYEAQIKGELAKAEVNMAEVKVYQARLDAERAKADVFRAQVDAFAAEISAEKLKIDIYRAQVDGYVAQVNAYSAEWNGYQAAVQGEAAAVNASAEQVRAFVAQAQAFETIVRGRVAALEAQNSVNQQKLLVFKAEVDAYSAKTNAEATAVAADINSYDATIKAYLAEAEAVSANSRSEIELYKVAHAGLVAAAELQFKYVQERNNTDVARAKAAGDLGAAIGEIFGRTAQSTLSGMNTLAAQSETITS